MNNFIKNTAFAALLTASLGSALTASAADELILRLQSNIFSYRGETNSFAVYLGSTEANVPVLVKTPKSEDEIILDPYSIEDDETEGSQMVATAIPASVTENDNIIEIYGDPAKIESIDIRGAFANKLELSDKLTNLSYIDLSHNELAEINLTPFANLEYIDVSDNLVTDPANMVIGANHPKLSILYVGQNEGVDATLDLRNYPALLYFSAWAANSFDRTLDTSACPDLTALNLELTSVSAVDVTKNPKLRVLTLSNSRITDIDLSANASLEQLYIAHTGSFNNTYKVSSINLSANPNLTHLDLAGNSLTAIDISKNPNITMLYLQSNKLSSIDLSANTYLSSVDLSDNDFDFATLPLPQDTWAAYYYYRRPFDAGRLSFKVGDPIDFSSRVIRKGYTTVDSVYVCPRDGAEYLLDPSKYTSKDGVITFLEAVADSVYVSFRCDAFPEYDLQTSQFMVKSESDYGKPSRAFALTPDDSMAGKQMSLSLGVAPVAGYVSLPADIVVNIDGKETTLAKAATSADAPATANVTFTVPNPASRVEILLPEGFRPTALAIKDTPLAAIDLTTAESLSKLTINGTGLSNIDLRFNRLLSAIDLSDNSLTTLSLAGVRGNYEKNMLTDIKAARNLLTDVTFVNVENIRTIDFSDNRITSFPLKNFEALREIDLSGNLLSGEISLTYQENAVSIDLSGNNIKSVLFPLTMNNLRSFDISDNNFTIATLPLFDSEAFPAVSNYAYAPQHDFAIVRKAPAVNLTALNRIVGTDTTAFTWKYADTGAVLTSAEVTCNGGATRFSDDIIGKSVFCEMTHPAFPAFDTIPLRTTAMEVAPKPTTVVAAFKTAENGTARFGFRSAAALPHALYVDWRGDQTEYLEYLYTEENAPFYFENITTYAGATATVYTYDDSTDSITVFGIDNTKLDNFDGSYMTKLVELDLHNTGLVDNKAKLPASPGLATLNLDGNGFSEATFTQYPRLRSLNLLSNNYKEFDFSIYPELMIGIVSDNPLEKVTFNNKKLEQLFLEANRLSKIDLSGLPELTHLYLAQNQFDSIDFSPVLKTLYVLDISNNAFTFKTLPRYSDFAHINVYYYQAQKPVEVTCTDGHIDLSDFARVGDSPTKFRWFLGEKNSDVYYDDYYEDYYGEELVGTADYSDEAVDDPEYAVTNGVTAFYYRQNRPVICAMDNEEFPNLHLYTVPAEIDSPAGVENVAVDNPVDTLVDVYTISGVRVRSAVSPDTAIDGLAPGLYIVGHKKVLVK